MSLLILWLAGCAPPGALPPPTSVAGEVGAAAGLLGSLPASVQGRPPREHLHGTLWFTPHASQRLQVSTVLSVSGTRSHSAAGVVARYALSDWEGPLFVHAEGGLLWGGVGLGAQRALGTSGWSVYTCPSLLWREAAWARLPVGLSTTTRAGLRLSAETGLTAAVAPSLRGSVWLALAVSRPPRRSAL